MTRTQMEFLLDDAALTRIFRIWNLSLPASGLVVFAFRGCLPVGVRHSEAKTVRLETIAPDYVHMRCTVGLWDRNSGRLFAAPGSTVPHRDNVVKAAARTGALQGRGTNQAEPGFYGDLAKGEHLQGKPDGHAALRQTGYRFYRRAHHPPPYTIRDPLYFGNPYDNLHCAWNPDPAAPGFRSAGCVVVAGRPHSPRRPDAQPNQGPWKTFHDLLYGASQRRFPLLLLPAQEVAAALSAEVPPVGLCYGSRGEAVKTLQRLLKAEGLYRGRATGILDARTYRAWNAAGFRLP